MKHQSIREHQKRLKQQALLIEEQLEVVSKILESLQTCLNDLLKIPKNSRQSQDPLFNSTTQMMAGLIDEAFERWVALEDEKDLLNDMLSRIKKFRDI